MRIRLRRTVPAGCLPAHVPVYSFIAMQVVRRDVRPALALIRSSCLPVGDQQNNAATSMSDRLSTTMYPEGHLTAGNRIRISPPGGSVKP